MSCGLYQIRNKENGKKYIGSSKYCEKRMRDHKRELRRGDHFNPHLQRSFDMYGEDSFKFFQFSSCQPEERLEREQEFLDAYQDFDDWDRLYNMNKNADKPPSRDMSGDNHHFYGKELSEDHKRALSDSNSGRDNHFYGKSHSEETRRKISENLKGKFEGEDNPFYDKNHTEESRREMSESHKGKEISEGVKKKLSKSMKEWWENCDKEKIEDRNSKITESLEGRSNTWLQGDKSPHTELTERDVKEIRRRYEEGDETYLSLSRDYPASQSAVGKIIRKDTWKHI